MEVLGRLKAHIGRMKIQAGTDFRVHCWGLPSIGRVQASGSELRFLNWSWGERSKFWSFGRGCV